jgi:hypothetical protein
MAKVFTLSCALMTVMVFGNGLGIVRPSPGSHPHLQLQQQQQQQQYRPLRHHFGRPSSAGRPYPAPVSALLIEDHIITTDPVVTAPNPCALVIPGLAAGGKSSVIDRLNLAKYFFFLKTLHSILM